MKHLSIQWVPQALCLSIGLTFRRCTYGEWSQLFLTALLIFNSSSSYNLTSYLNQLSKSWCPNHSNNILHILVTHSLVSWSYQEPHIAYSHVSSVSFKYRLVFQPFFESLSWHQITLNYKLMFHFNNLNNI